MDNCQFFTTAYVTLRNHQITVPPTVVLVHHGNVTPVSDFRIYLSVWEVILHYTRKHIYCNWLQENRVSVVIRPTGTVDINISPPAWELEEKLSLCLWNLPSHRCPWAGFIRKVLNGPSLSAGRSHTSGTCHSSNQNKDWVRPPKQSNPLTAAPVDGLDCFRAEHEMVWRAWNMNGCQFN